MSLSRWQLSLSSTLLALVLLSPAIANGDSMQYSLGDIRNCHMQSPLNSSQSLLRMEVMPGRGWDNLRNIDMGQVFVRNYSLCSISADGRYILPDSIFLIPEQQSNVDVFAELFEHWDNYTSTTATTINLEVSSSFANIDSKFSTEFQSVKEKQYNSKAKTTRVQIRHKLYKVQIQPNSQLHPAFKAMLYDILTNVQSNNTQYANYMAELMVRDYGTHYIRSMDAGAVLSQVDHISSDYVQNHQFDSTNITASASATFFKAVNVKSSFSYVHSNSDLNGYTSNRSHSQIHTYGGPPFRPGFSLDDWEAGVRDALVPTDRTGDPLYYIINPTTLPEIVETDVFQLQNVVYNAIKRYYMANTLRGCTNPTSKNFVFTANVDNGHCQKETKNSSFGGVFQTCTTNPEKPQSPWVDLCKTKSLDQVNTRTGEHSCPTGYHPVELISQTLIQGGTENIRVCSFWLLGCWHHRTEHISIKSFATYTTYWCAPTGDSNPTDGYLFGGAFTSNQMNPVTSSLSCPLYFQEFRMGADGVVCVSEEFDLAFPFSVPFGGFESCNIGNPLTTTGTRRAVSSNWLHDCPKGFSKYLMMVEAGCELSYCVKSGVFDAKSLPPARLPPFSKHQHHIDYNDVPATIIGRQNTVWIRDLEGLWRIADTAEMEEIQAAMALLTPPPLVSSSNITQAGSVLYNLTAAAMELTSGTALSRLNNGEVAAISVVSTVVFCTLIAAAIFIGFSVKRKRKLTVHNEYLNINEVTVGNIDPAESSTI